jgi:CheY-like chemotaxis protein
MADYIDPARILIVDDEPASVRQLERLLEAAGYRCLERATASEALARFRTVQPDLVLLDLTKAHLDGIALLEQLKAEVAAGDYVPVLVFAPNVTFETKRRALSAGANDFLSTPFEQVEVVLRTSNLLKIRRLHRALDDHRRLLHGTALLR